MYHPKLVSLLRRTLTDKASFVRPQWASLSSVLSLREEIGLATPLQVMADVVTFATDVWHLAEAVTNA